MAIAVYIDQLNSGIEVAHHCCGIRVLGEIAVACSERHSEQSQGSKLHSVETPVLIHVTQPDHHGTIVESHEAAKRETLCGLAEVGYEGTTGNGDYKIHVAIVVQVASGYPSRRNWAVRAAINGLRSDSAQEAP